MEAAIHQAIPAAKVELVRGGGGDFIVTADGKEIWDKRGADGDFPEDQEVLQRLNA